MAAGFLAGILWLAVISGGCGASLNSGYSIPSTEFLMVPMAEIGAGSNARFTVDSQGGVHIAFVNGSSSNHLYYITNASGNWAPALLIDDPQGGVLTPDIAVDTMGNVHIASPHDWAGGAYLTNSSGDWAEANMGGRFTPQIAVSGDGTAHIVYYNILLSTNTFLGLTYWNSTAGFPSTGIRDNNTQIRFSQFPDVAVDSTGKVHVVFEGSWNNTALGNIAVRDIYYEVIDPTLEEPAFSSAVRISSVMSTGDYACWPQIVCDSEDNIHFCWLETKMVVEGGINVYR